MISYRIYSERRFQQPRANASVECFRHILFEPTMTSAQGPENPIHGKALGRRVVYRGFVFDERMVTGLQYYGVVCEAPWASHHHRHNAERFALWVGQYEPEMRLTVWVLAKEEGSARADQLPLLAQCRSI